MSFLKKLMFPLKEFKVKSFYLLKFGFFPPLTSDFETSTTENDFVMGEFQDLYDCKTDKDRKIELTLNMGNYIAFKQLVTKAIKLKEPWDIKMSIVWQFYCYPDKNQTEINFLKTLV